MWWIAGNWADLVWTGDGSLSDRKELRDLLWIFILIVNLFKVTPTVFVPQEGYHVGVFHWQGYNVHLGRLFNI